MRLPEEVLVLIAQQLVEMPGCMVGKGLATIWVDPTRFVRNVLSMLSKDVRRVLRPIVFSRTVFFDYSMASRMSNAHVLEHAVSGSVIDSEKLDIGLLVQALFRATKMEKLVIAFQSGCLRHWLALESEIRLQGFAQLQNLRQLDLSTGYGCSIPFKIVKTLCESLPALTRLVLLSCMASASPWAKAGLIGGYDAANITCHQLRSMKLLVSVQLSKCTCLEPALAFFGATLHVLTKLEVNDTRDIKGKHGRPLVCSRLQELVFLNKARAYESTAWTQADLQILRFLAPRLRTLRIENAEPSSYYGSREDRPALDDLLSAVPDTICQIDVDTNRKDVTSLHCEGLFRFLRLVEKKTELERIKLRLSVGINYPQSTMSCLSKIEEYYLARHDLKGVLNELDVAVDFIERF